MTHCQPNLPLGLRIIAAGCIAVWLTAVSACSLEAVFCCDSHEHEHEAVTHAEHQPARDSEPAEVEAHHAEALSDDAEAHHSHDSERHSHGPHKHDREDGSCCTTLKANVQTSKPFFINKPVFHPIPFLCVLPETRTAALGFSDKAPSRQPKTRDWVLTPEVCTGPANRSHAPPLLF